MAESLPIWWRDSGFYLCSASLLARFKDQTKMPVRMLIALSFSIMMFAAVTRPTHAQDAAAGEKSFAKCRACHQVGETAKNSVGPELNGLFGRKSGSAAGYNFSEANKNSGITWDPAIFAEYIQNPKGKIPGTKMAFAGIKNEQEIKDLIAFLAQYDADGKKK